MRERYAGSHKYGRDPFAAYLDERHDWADETVGSVDEWGYHYARFGKHVLTTDVYGFVSHSHVTDDEWETLVDEWSRWMDGETGVWE